MSEKTQEKKVGCTKGQCGSSKVCPVTQKECSTPQACASTKCSKTASSSECPVTQKSTKSGCVGGVCPVKSSCAGGVCPVKSSATSSTGSTTQ